MSLPWHFHPVVGERVTLDLLRASDLDALFAIQSDPEVCRYLLYGPRTREEVSDVLARDAAKSRLGGPEDYIQPALRLPDGTLIGTMYLHVRSVDDKTAEIGWLLDPRFQGQGYAREGAALVLDLAFDELGMHRVYAELDPRNDASVALCLRLGMRHEAHFVEHMWFKGAWADTGHYAVLEREWRVSFGNHGPSLAP